MGKDDQQSWEDRIDDIVLQSVATLKEAELIDYSQTDSRGQLSSTEYGDIMSKVRTKNFQLYF
jgi:ATP-dependent DNA helicase HFM1/MER3